MSINDQEKLLSTLSNEIDAMKETARSLKDDLSILESITKEIYNKIYKETGVHKRYSYCRKVGDNYDVQKIKHSDKSIC